MNYGSEPSLEFIFIILGSMSIVTIIIYWEIVILFLIMRYIVYAKTKKEEYGLVRILGELII